MGSIGDEELVQMVRDFYEPSESNNINPFPPISPSPSIHQIRQSALLVIIIFNSFSKSFLFFFPIVFLVDSLNYRKSYWMQVILRVKFKRKSSCILETWVNPILSRNGLSRDFKWMVTKLLFVN